MSRILNFSKRNFKEVLRDPLIYIFCLGFPVVMLLLFQIISHYSSGHTPMFELTSLLPAIIMFSYTFIMLTMSLLVSKDKQTFFLKRLYSSPMKPHHFVLGYTIVGLIIGIVQTVICILSAFLIALITNANFISFGNVILLTISQLPILITNIFLGILFGTLLSDKSAPGISSIFISMAGILGGCWMPIETMGGFKTFCKTLPFYPSVYLGRIITNATKNLNSPYTFDNTAIWGIVTILIYMITSIVLSCFIFKKNMVSDK